MFAALAIVGTVCFVTAGLAKSVGLGRDWEKMGVIEYLVSSYLLDGLKSFWRDGLEE